MRPLCLICLFTAICLFQTVTARPQINERCSSCRSSILFKYVRVEGRSFHPSCFTCNHCNKVIQDQYTVHRSKYYHPTCFKDGFQPPCTICGRLISGEYYEDYWGTTYCAAHVSDVPLCDFCERPISGPLTGDGLLLPDGRRLCGVCKPSAVTSERDAKLLMQEAARRLESLGIKVDLRDVTLLLLGIDKLDLLNPERESHCVGYTDYVGFPDDEGQMKCEAFNIYLLYGMPAIQMTATLAHELMHVWQLQHGILWIDKTLCEGSCEYASYRVLGAIGTTECKYLCRRIGENTDLVYGGGFRDVKDYVERNGVEAWLRKLQDERHTGVPPNLTSN